MKKFAAILFVWVMVLGCIVSAYKRVIDNAPIELVDDETTIEKPEDRVDEAVEPPTPKPPEEIVAAAKKITLALDGFSGYYVFRSPAFKAKLAAQGLDFEAVDDKADYPKRMVTVQQGRTPFAVFTIDSLLGQTPYSGPPPATIVLLLDETRGADAMISYASGVKDISALDDSQAKLVMVADSPSEALSRVVRAKFSLPKFPTRKAEFLIPIASSKGAEGVYSAFLNAKPTDKQAFVLWEPYVSMALQEKKAEGAQLLIDSSQFSGYIVDVLVVQREYLEQNRDRVLAVTRAYLETLHEFSPPDVTVEQVYADFQRVGEDKLTKSQAVQVVKGIRWKNTVENYAHFNIRPAGLETVTEMLKNITLVLEQTKQPGDRQQGVERPDRLWDDRILRELSTANLHVGSQQVQAEIGALVELTEGQWQELLPVGAIKTRPIPFTSRNKLNVDEGADVILKEIEVALRDWPQYYFRVEGDVLAASTSNRAADESLATARAEAVVDYLQTELQVPAHRLKAVAVVTGIAREVRVVAMRKP